MIRFFTIAASKAKSFRDTFTRSNETLDRSSDGTKWDESPYRRGIWSIISNKLSVSDNPSTYPITTVPTPGANVDISLKGITQGTTAALWVTDSGNWWGVGIDQTSVDCNCATCYNYSTNYTPVACGTNYCQGNCATTNYVCNAYNYTCNVVNNRYCKSSSCASWKLASGSGFYVCATWKCNSWNAGNCNESYAQQHNCKTASYPCATYNYYACGTNYCAAWYTTVSGSYSCNCQTCYPQYIRIIQSASNVVTTFISQQVNSVINSLKVLVRGSQITTKAYSDPSLVTQINSDLVYTPTSVAVTPRYGIIVKPSSYAQGNTISGIDIENA